MAGKGKETHQPGVCFLVGAVDRHDLGEGLDLGGVFLAGFQQAGQLEEQVETQEAQGLAARDSPVLIEVLGEQVAGIERQGGLELGRFLAFEGLIGGGFKGVDIDVGPIAEAEESIFEEERNGPGLVEDLAGGEEGLVEIIGRGGEVRVRPERIQDLVAMQTVGRGQGEQLDQVAGAPGAPLFLRDRQAVDPDQKTSQKLKTQLIHRHVGPAFIRGDPAKKLLNRSYISIYLGSMRKKGFSGGVGSPAGESGGWG